MVNLIDGKKISEEILKNCKNEIDNLAKKFRKPSLVLITSFYDEASKIYVKKKEEACEYCNIDFKNINFEENTPKMVVLEEIEKLNNDKNVDGIFIQVPVPNHLVDVGEFIKPTKDIDAFNIQNLGKTLFNNNTELDLMPCTCEGIIYLIERINFDITGKHIVIIGRSNIVGKPLIGMLLRKNATVTSCNSYTKDLREITRTADILITAIGKANFIDSSYISDKTDVIIDAGINRLNNKVCGDVDFNNIMTAWEDTNKNKYITPVPGGVGPMTVAELINNVLKCYKYNLKKFEAIK